MNREQQQYLQDQGIVLATERRGVNGYTHLDASHFAQLADQIGHNDQLLHPTAEQMAQSYNEGKAVALFNAEHRPVGFARLIDLISPELRGAIELPPGFPDIAELGTVYISPEDQGKGLNPIMQNELLRTVLQQIKDKELLILLTTKTQKVVNSLNKASALGINFTVLSHTSPGAEMIAPFTCTCGTEHDTSFGSGFGIGKTLEERASCSKRVGQTELITIRTKADLARTGVKPVGNPKIMCTEGVSDIHLMYEMNQQLRQHYGRINAYSPQEELVNRLVKAGYYE